MEDPKTQLAKELAAMEWQTIIPHAKRDAVIFVSEYLNLLNVGLAIAQDDTLSVQHWISEQLIHKPNDEQLGSWNDSPNKQFSTLIVQPFVLIQDTASQITDIKKEQQ